MNNSKINVFNGNEKFKLKLKTQFKRRNNKIFSTPPQIELILKKRKKKITKISNLTGIFLNYKKRFKSKSSYEKYKKNLWKKNFLVIAFYVNLFRNNIKRNSRCFKFKKLKEIHYNLINDLTYFQEENKNEFMNQKIENLKKEHQKLVQKAHTFKIQMKTHIFCKEL